MFVPFLIIRYIHTKTKLILLPHLPSSCVAPNYTDTPWAFGSESFIYDCLPFFAMPQRRSYCSVLVNGTGGCLAWHRRGRWKSGKRRVRGLLFQSGLVLITSDSEPKPGRMLRQHFRIQWLQFMYWFTLKKCLDHITSWGISKHRSEGFKSWVFL